MEAYFRNLVAGRSAGPGPMFLRGLLAAGSIPYRICVATRNWLYDAGVWRPRQVSIPVISVGNITLGGTGKTPLVQFLCRQLLGRSKRVVILSRGYGATQDANDEALLLRASLPEVLHLQGANRVELARRAVAQYHPDVLVLDDGFQHRRLARDLDIVLIDCTEPFGYGRLFPRGLLREPISSLRRAELLVLSRSDLCAEQERREIWQRIVTAVGAKPVVLAEHRPLELCDAAGGAVPLAALSGKPVAVFCGIGNPTAFCRTLGQLGCRMIAMCTFSDHHRYSDTDLESLSRWVRQLGAALAVTTEKDLVKIGRRWLSGVPLLALKIELAINEPKGELQQALDTALT